MRSHAVSGFSTTPKSLLCVSATNSGLCTCTLPSGMGGGLLLHFLGEEHALDPLRQLPPLAPLGATLAVQLRLHLPGMGREQEDPVPDQHCLRDRVRDEEHGEVGVVPELQELVLHLAAGGRVERGGGVVPEQDLPPPPPPPRNSDPPPHPPPQRMRGAVRELS